LLLHYWPMIAVCIVHHNVTRNPNTLWVALQIHHAWECGEQPQHFLIFEAGASGRTVCYPPQRRSPRPATLSWFLLLSDGSFGCSSRLSSPK
jgi:hypothetical protein